MAKSLHAIAAPHKWDKGRPSGWLHRAIPFAGGLGELWGWECEGVSEVVNDLDDRLTDFYDCLRSGVDFAEFARLCQATPFSEALWERARDFFSLPLRERRGHPLSVRAHHFFVLVRQSMGGRMKSFAPLVRTRLRRGMQDHVSAWWTAVDGLPEAHERLRRVVVRCGDAIPFIRREDGENTLFYVDPPYVHEARAVTDVYRHEMSEEQHEKLLDVLLACKGYVMVSGYESKLYGRLDGWEKHSFPTPNHSGSGRKKQARVEVVWTNKRFRGG